MPIQDAAIVKLKLDAAEYIRQIHKAAASTEKLERSTKKVAKAADDAATKTDRFIKSIAGLYIARRVAQGLDKLVTSTFKYESAVKAVTISMEPAVRALEGFASRAELTEVAARGTVLGLSFTSEGFAKLARSAALAGQAMGKDAVRSVDDLLLGIARLQPKILDNVGILLTLSDAYKKYADSVGKSVDQLSKAEQQQAVMEESTRQLAAKVSGELGSGSAASAYIQLKNSLKDVNTEFGKMLSRDSRVQAAIRGMSALARATRGALSVFTAASASEADIAAANQRRINLERKRAQEQGSAEHRIAVGITTREQEDARLKGEVKFGKIKVSPIKSKGREKDPFAAQFKARAKVEEEAERRRQELAEMNAAIEAFLAEEALERFQEQQDAKLAITEATNIAIMRSERLVEEERQRNLQNQLNGYKALTDMVSGAATGALRTFAFATIDAAVAGENLGDALKNSFSQFLSSFAKQMAVKALGATADGLKDLAMLNIPGAGANFTAAAAYSAAAVAAGVGAGALAPSRPTRRARGISRGLGGARSEGTDTGGGGNTYTFSINTLLAPADEEEYARAIGNGVRLAGARGHL